MSKQDSVGFLEEEALKRKERLKNLKRKNNDTTTENCEKSLTLPKPKFRSYKPGDDTLKENSLPDGKPSSVEEEVKDQLNSANSQVVIDDINVANLAPRKVDWDLKRNVAKKLDILEIRTQKAIAELIRERLKERQGDLATAIAGAELEAASADN